MKMENGKLVLELHDVLPEIGEDKVESTWDFITEVAIAAELALELGRKVEYQPSRGMRRAIRKEPA